MLDRQRRQVSVGHEVRRGLPGHEQVTKHLEVAAGRVNDTDARLFQPTIYSPDRLVERQRVLIDPRIRADANERGEDRPAEADRISTRKLLVLPVAGPNVVASLRVFRVEQ